MDGVIVDSLNFKLPQDAPQDAAVKTLNETLIGKLKEAKRVFAVDYCTKGSGNAANSITKYDELGIVGLTRLDTNPSDFSQMHDIRSEDANTSITNIDSTDLNNFVLIDTPVSGVISSLEATNYDLIVMSPFTSASWSTMHSAADVARLKSKHGNANSKRLVYAYIDISMALKTNDYYWQTAWNDERPNWIPGNMPLKTNEFYIYYWRNEWVEPY